MLSFFHRGSWAERNPIHADFVVMNGHLARGSRHNEPPSTPVDPLA
jgi:hypothetical protein